MTYRIACINPNCRCTAAQDRFPGSTSIICGERLAADTSALSRALEATKGTGSKAHPPETQYPYRPLNHPQGI